jgi:hypothetical protein
MPAPAPKERKKKDVKLDFFKPFSKKYKLVSHDIGEDIVVAPRQPRTQDLTVKPEDALQSTPKGDSARASRSEPSSSKDVCSPTRALPIGIRRKSSQVLRIDDAGGSGAEPGSSNNVFSPTRALPIGTPKKNLQLPQVDGPGDQTFRSPVPSQTRTLKAVEIPSPRNSPPLSKQVDERPAHTTFTSFSSVSTLSSVPMSSANSSRRILKDGMKAVTNSDSGSADSESDELADPIIFLSRKRRKLTPPGENAEHAIEIVDSTGKGQHSSRLSNMDRRSNAGAKARLPPSPPRNVYKHSLMKLVKQRQNEEKTTSRIKDAEAAFDEAQRKREERVKQAEDITSGLKAAVADDSDEGDRMMLAMQRTEALQEDEKFYFFRNGSQMIPEAFPSLRGPDGRFTKSWMKALQNETSRKHAFLSGFVADVASTEPLPSLLASWIENQLFFEARTDLLEAYVEVLQIHIAQASADRNEIPGLSYYYKTLGNLDKTGYSDRATVSPGRPRALAQVLQVQLQLCMSQAKFSASAGSFVVELMLAAIDENLKGSADLVSTIHEVLDNVLEAIPNAEQFDTVCKQVHQTFFERTHLSKQRQCEVISSMPASSGRAQHLRRLLALHLLGGFTATPNYSPNLQSPYWVEIIKKYLETDADFNISQTTDYKLLNALIGILDIAIDAGFTELDSAMPFSTKTKVKLNKSSSTPSAAARFNSQIDNLTQVLQSISSQIRGSGTSHLRRTEAKSSLDRLILRLEHGVRTRPKARKGIFGGATGEQRDFLSSFLKPLATGRDETEDGVRVVPLEMVGDRAFGNGQQSPDEASAMPGAQSA